MGGLLTPASTSSRAWASQATLPPRTSKSATRSPMSSLRRCSASSFGPLPRESPMRSGREGCSGDSGISDLLVRVQFSKLSPPSVQRRRLPLAGVWPGKFGRPISLVRHWPVLIFQELCSIVLVGPRAIFKVQPAKCTEAVLALGKGLARKVRPTNLIGEALVSSHLSGIVSASANRAALHGFRFRDQSQEAPKTF